VGGTFPRGMLLERHAQIYFALQPDYRTEVQPGVIQACVGPDEGGRTICSRGPLLRVPVQLCSADFPLTGF
jgi:hypothetical protein